MDWHGKTALVTGASSGIGAATARRLAKEGLQIILVARRVERLDQLASEIHALGGQAVVIGADLGVEAERVRVYDAVMQDFGCPDVLINNAGFAWYGYLANLPWKTAHEMIALNVEGTAHLTHLFLPHMLARRSGRIIIVGSINGGFPNQGTALYSGTKAFADAFTTALYRELVGSGVRVSMVRPGPVATELFDISENLENGTRIPMEKSAILPEAVASTIWSLLRRPRRVLYAPRWMMVLPVVELAFGWLIDLVGPVLLRDTEKKRRAGGGGAGTG